MPIDLYETRTMLAAVELMMPVRTFFRDTFFPGVNTYVTEKVDVDYRKGKRKMAPMVARNAGGVNVDRQNFQTYTFATPYIAPQRVLTKNDISKRMIGENIYSSRTPEQRARELLAKDLVELREMITRREEWLCRQLLLEGKVVIKGWVDRVGGSEYVEDTVDYNFTNRETLSGSSAWDQAGDKLQDLKKARLEIIKATGRNPNLVIMAQNVMDLYIKDPDIRALLDIRNLTIGTIQPRYQMDGVTYIGTLASLGLELYTYDEWFVDDDGREHAMMPDDYLIMGSANLGSREYGAITQIEESDTEFHTYEGQIVPKSWTNVENDVKMLRLASRPLPKPDNVDSWYVLKVK